MGKWIGVAHRGTQLALDINITPELQLEGIARDIIRGVQILRKKAGLRPEDRIGLHLETDSETIRSAITVHQKTIWSETLAVRTGDAPFNTVSHLNLYDGTATISIERVENS